ncbi:unnamed protein product [Durusdinium trenchii]|uniref:DNA (cytosine-5-)-methyltransferase n=1 Tax=Durusdinium trenchii TaxID=1381693 RepID=A0ABP0SD35_9DINO
MAGKPALAILFKGTDTPVLLSELTMKQEMWLENGRPFEYVRIDPPMEGEPSEHEDGWAGMAGEEMDALSELNDKIMEAELTESSGEEKHSAGSSKQGVASAAERVARYQASLIAPDMDQSKETYCVEDFKRVVKELKVEGERPHHQTPIKVLSGCTGMLAEGWVCKLLGIPVESYNCSDPKPESYSIVNLNFGPQVASFHKTLQEQISRLVEPCHSDSQEAADAKHLENPDLAVAGTPCQPFSRQRSKRSADNSVRSHSKFSTTFVDLLDWLRAFEPKCGAFEQVEGLDCPESTACRTTPLERLLELLDAKEWGHGGYHMEPVRMDSSAWINMSRPRTLSGWVGTLSRVGSSDAL